MSKTRHSGIVYSRVIGTDPKGEAGKQKPQMQLIPPALNAETSKALALGAQKYGPWNWRENKVDIMTYLGAMKRHLDAVIEGEDIDPESGAHHLGHVAAGCGIVLDAQKHGTLVDNRPPQAAVQATAQEPHKPACFGDSHSMPVRICQECKWLTQCSNAQPLR